MSIDSSVTGIGRNPFNILDAVDYIGPDGIEEYNADARDYNVVSGVGDDSVLFDTSYFEINELVGLHQVVVRWWKGGTANINIRYYWINPSGEEGYYTIERGGDDDPNYGHRIVGNFFFEENYQYRIQIRIKADNEFPDLTKTYIDYVNLVPINVNNTQTNIDALGVNEYCTHSSAGGTCNLYPDYVQVERFGKDEITGNGSPSKEITINFPTTPYAYFPVASMYSRNTNYSMQCTIEEMNTTNFVVKAYLRDGGNWSGTYDVLWHATCLEEYTRLNDDLLRAK